MIINERFPIMMMMMKIGFLSPRHEAISTDAGSHPAIVETGATTRGRGTDLMSPWWTMPRMGWAIIIHNQFR
jgi:hypothetical protein